MTVKEFFNYCVANDIEDFKIFVDVISMNGCFVGYKELTYKDIDIGYGGKIISLG